MSKYTVHHHFETPDTDREIEVEMTIKAYKGWPGSYWEPAEPAELIVEEIWILSKFNQHILLPDYHRYYELFNSDEARIYDIIEHRLEEEEYYLEY